MRVAAEPAEVADPGESGAGICSELVMIREYLCFRDCSGSRLPVSLTRKGPAFGRVAGAHAVGHKAGKGDFDRAGVR
ncbi:hypothetical protein GCM10010387_66900 [Streptomyces inusitatus]|uniref:Uncharacterized protein n=1 Tax=Streptomyces inusitatus TaxID=68221 RepID=A0A918QSA3_9ACTN|nr:hypothetical protein GCM10010387_66900 [Streptomyces inusitatus]